MKKIIALLVFSIACTPLASKTKQENIANLTESFDLLTREIDTASRNPHLEASDQRALERLRKKLISDAKKVTQLDTPQLEQLSIFYTTLANAYAKNCQSIPGLATMLKRKTDYPLANAISLLMLADEMFAHAKKLPSALSDFTQSFLSDQRSLRIAHEAIKTAKEKKEITTINAELTNIAQAKPESSEEKEDLKARKNSLQQKLKLKRWFLQDVLKYGNFSELGDSTLFKIRSWIGAHPYLTATAIFTTLATVAGGAYAFKNLWLDKRSAKNRINKAKGTDDCHLSDGECEKLIDEFNLQIASEENKLKKQIPTSRENREPLYEKYLDLEKKAKTHQEKIESLVPRAGHKLDLHSVFVDSFISILNNKLYPPNTFFESFSDKKLAEKTKKDCFFAGYENWKSKQV